MSLGILYLGLFAVLDPWFSVNVLLSDDFQVCKLHVVLVCKTVVDCNNYCNVQFITLLLTNAFFQRALPIECHFFLKAPLFH